MMVLIEIILKYFAEETKRQWKKPKIEYADVGSTVRLNCNADWNPISIRWSRQYGQMQPGKDLQSVSIFDYIQSINCRSEHFV